ncbi:tyrosine-type recombinase/integrase [Micromonospora sp. DT4]|uniref:tyrosine-type recombinase/integrase n=1 Tax=Micromonospora sp. DT4 TaxID=3393438 RepID=UPI003CF5FDEF
MAELASTGKVRRTRPVDPSVVDGSRYRRGRITPEAPAPSPAALPYGDLSRASEQQIVDLAMRVWPGQPPALAARRHDLRGLLRLLARFDGDTWQQRWDGCGYADGGLPRRGLEPLPHARLINAFRMLISLRVIRPRLAAVNRTHAGGFAQMFRHAQNDPALGAYFTAVADTSANALAKSTALFDIARALAVFGIPLADLTPAGLLAYSWQCRDSGAGLYRSGNRSSFSARLAWAVLAETGHFPPGTPPTINAAGQRGQLTVTELVDQYPIANRDVRQLLIDYLTRRELGMDYSTMRNLARMLAGLFWLKIEHLLPGIAELKIPDHVYEQWREAIRLREDGRERLSVDPILLAVRSFYLDLHTWSASEPDRWARWVAPCPISGRELAGSARRDRKRVERSQERTRSRQPLLPILVAHVEGRLTHHRQLLAAATAAQAGQRFTVEGRDYERVWTDYDQQWKANDPIRARDLATGKIINVRLVEDACFWDWALVEVLRHTGCRIEEALELTQLSIRRYLRPNGETIGLLVVAPSKTERERIIPMSGELFAVIAAIIRRHQDATASVPILPRYDNNERLHTDPMPFLFSRRHGHARQVLGQHQAVAMLARRCRDLSATHPEFGQSRFTPHDFRRLFATDLVNNGLPIHIGAALLGHLDLNTTRGYVAVFDEDLVRHYQTFLANRRALRPVEEYRPATDDEWREFETHFDKRKVELGNCGRPYGTGCAHEHACLRCPMLHVPPDALPRLDVIEADLHDRRARAETEQWLGEIEGIDITLDHLRRKRTQTIRLTAGPTIPISPPHEP